MHCMWLFLANKAENVIEWKEEHMCLLNSNIKGSPLYLDIFFIPSKKASTSITLDLNFCYVFFSTKNNLFARPQIFRKWLNVSFLRCWKWFHKGTRINQSNGGKGTNWQFFTYIYTLCTTSGAGISLAGELIYYHFFWEWLNVTSIPSNLLHIALTFTSSWQ